LVFVVFGKETLLSLEATMAVLQSLPQKIKPKPTKQIVFHKIEFSSIFDTIHNKAKHNNDRVMLHACLYVYM
jgi:hypothetical protein